MKAPIHSPSKLNLTAALILTLLTIVTVVSADDPRTNSWFTTYSGQYARVYTNNSMKTAGTALTTWSNGSQTQSAPAYCGVQEVYSSSNSVYIRSTGLAGYTMGPWQNGSFPNLPKNQQLLYRLPRTNNVPAAKPISGGGQIGIFVDGVEMFNSWDAFAWNGSAEVSAGMTTYYWNRDAYVNEGATFDAGNAHQQNTGTYHYHANPPALRYLLGDHVDYNAASKTFTESATAPTKHSPILGWVADGFPIYGPYGYSVSNDAGSGIRRMISGYVVRNGANGTSNLTANGRSTIPQWAARLFNVALNIVPGPPVNTTYPLGRYMEDNDFLGDHGIAPGTNTYDLDEYNGRWCVTPEFPNGTYAYFVAIAADGTPLFPYNIGRGFYGSNSGASAGSITETVATNFLGGPNAVPQLNALTMKNGMVTLTWSATEGGTYMVQSTTNFSTWTTNSTTASAVLNSAGYTNNPTDNARFYRVARTALAAYDGGGGITAAYLAPGGSVSLGTGTNITVSITLPTGGSNPPMTPPAGGSVSSITLGGITGTSVSYAVQGTVVATFALTTGNSTPGAKNIIVTFPPPPLPAPQNNIVFTLTGGFTINP
ncbi:MAG TPA: YHYH protein [Verrucomicrobiae bacterium]|nr:YHYH protein [Verrucomicrobiae bacterium]